MKFDIDRLERIGEPFEVQDDILTSAITGNTGYSVSRDGRKFIYIEGGPGYLNSRIVWVNRDGKIQAVQDSSRLFKEVVLSPDRKKIAVTIGGANERIEIYDLDSNNSTQITLKGMNLFPRWSPDSREVIFYSLGKDEGVYFKKIDQSEEAKEILAGRKYPNALSSDGHYLVLTSDNNIIIYSFDENRSFDYISSDFPEGYPVFSPDNQRIAFTSIRHNVRDIYVRGFPDILGEKKISIDGGFLPLWNSNDKEELFFINDNRIFSVKVNYGPPVTADVPKELFTFNIYPNYLFHSYDYDPIKDLFIFVEQMHESSVSGFKVVTNFSEKLKRLDPENKN
jgi:Tol biopolymer transport system component